MNSKVFWFIFLSTTTQGISLADYPRILYDEPIDTPGLTTQLPVTTTERPETTTESDNVPKWVPASNGRVPTGAIEGGIDTDNSIFYVARAGHYTQRGFELIPGKLRPSAGVTYISYGGREYAKNNYEVLVGCTANWVETSGSRIPANAIRGGEAYDGSYYVCRVRVSGTITNGKMHITHSTCYIPFYGTERGYTRYEILCCS